MSVVLLFFPVVGSIVALILLRRLEAPASSGSQLNESSRVLRRRVRRQQRKLDDLHELILDTRIQLSDLELKVGRDVGDVHRGVGTALNRLDRLEMRLGLVTQLDAEVERLGTQRDMALSAQSGRLDALVREIQRLDDQRDVIVAAISRRLDVLEAAGDPIDRG